MLNTSTRNGAGLVLAVVIVGAITFGGLAHAPADAQECPSRVDDAAFVSASRMRAWNKVMADAGPRPTASSAHERFVDWLETSVRRIPGLKIRSLPDSIDRWLEQGAALRMSANGRTSSVAVSGAVPYSRAGTVRGKLVYVPPGTAITDADVKGKIVLRDMVAGAIPYPVFFAVAYYVHDPELSIDYTSNYERDFAGYAQRITDLEQAADEGADGVIFSHELPRAQVAGNYQPYEGKPWRVPAVFVGADEGELLKKAKGATAELTVRAKRTKRAPTRNLIATLPGQSRERIVIGSHTDGMNAIWDNGPISILALASYLAKLPRECRPRTYEFVLSTAHLYLSRNGAHHYAELLDHAYDDGTVAFVVALEHLGAREYLAYDRKRSPGRELRPSGESEPFVVFVHESPVSLQATLRSVIDRDLRRTFVLRGADAPQAGFPPHRSYGGEGGAYHGELLPTIAAITGPWTLYNPSFGMEIVDIELMRRQTMAFGDVVLQLQDVPKELIAGADTAYRAGRDATE